MNNKNINIKNPKFIVVATISTFVIIGLIILFIVLLNKKNSSNTPMNNITWSENNTFTYDGYQHAIFISGEPSNANVTYTGGEHEDIGDGNFSTTPGVWHITATIKASGYKTWIGTHDLVINNAPSLLSWLKLQDGTMYDIDTTGDFCTNRTVSSTFDFKDLPSGTNQSVQKDQITEIHLVNLPHITTAPNNYLQYMCYDMVNLSIANIVIPNTINSVGNNFCANMFYQCTSLNSLPTRFTIPQSITSVGNDFCHNMFYKCAISTLPNTFVLPSGIVGNVGNSFCDGMFYDCTFLSSLPSSFIIPNGITTAGTSFCANMFINCTSLSDLSNFTIGTSITGTVGDFFCAYMFENCDLLTKLPNNFTIPTGITSSGTYFYARMFQNCTALISLPNNFNLPQNITTVGDWFCAYTFYNCSSLKNNNASKINIHIPNITISNYCHDMFSGCFSLSGVVASPSPNSNIYINSN